MVHRRRDRRSSVEIMDRDGTDVAFERNMSQIIIVTKTGTPPYIGAHITPIVSWVLLSSGSLSRIEK